MRISSPDWLRERTSGRGERRAQRPLKRQTRCPDGNGELENQEMSSEDVEANSGEADEDDEKEELEETEDETAEQVSAQKTEKEEDAENEKKKPPNHPKT